MSNGFATGRDRRRSLGGGHAGNGGSPWKEDRGEKGGSVLIHRVSFGEEQDLHLRSPLNAESFSERTLPGDASTNSVVSSSRAFWDSGSPTSVLFGGRRWTPPPPAPPPPMPSAALPLQAQLPPHEHVKSYGGLARAGFGAGNHRRESWEEQDRLRSSGKGASPVHPSKKWLDLEEESLQVAELLRERDNSHSPAAPTVVGSNILGVVSHSVGSVSEGPPVSGSSNDWPEMSSVDVAQGGAQREENLVEGGHEGVAVDGQDACSESKVEEELELELEVEEEEEEEEEEELELEEEEAEEEKEDEGKERKEDGSGDADSGTGGRCQEKEVFHEIADGCWESLVRSDGAAAGKESHEDTYSLTASGVASGTEPWKQGGEGNALNIHISL